MISIQKMIWLERAGILNQENIITEASTLAGEVGSARADYDRKKYIDPHVGSELPTHEIAKDHGSIQSGSKVRLHKLETKTVGNKKILHAHVEDEHGNKEVVPVTKLKKPGEPRKNAGFDYEDQFIEHLKKHGLMKPEAKGAGSTGGNDFHLINKRTNNKIKGRVNSTVDSESNKDINFGETKKDASAAFGQITAHYHPTKGWHIPDSSRANRPRYAAEVEKSGILDHLNKYHHPDKVEKTASGKAKNVVLSHDNMKPAEEYLRDHHVDVLQVGSHGTYSVGDKDKTGHGLPRLKGRGLWTVRQKTLNANHRTIQFQPHGARGLERSHVDIGKEDDMKKFKKSLGHE
jgi:hypothetical protein